MHRRHGRLVAALLATTALTTAGWAQNLPTGGAVAHGGVTIATPSASSMTINQSTSTAIVNWQGFSIGQGNRVDIIQPSSSSALLNRVTGSTPSTIAGQLNANGQVYLVNPNGIAITRSGTVNAAGFVGSTLGITDADFKAGRARFTGNGNSAKVSNAGTITIGRGGYAALLGGQVANSGTIAVPQGRVGFGAGEAATLDFSGDGFLQVSVPSTGTRKGALIRHSGNISGNMVEMKAATARDAARRAINLSGVVEATSVGGRSGAIVLGGGRGGSVKVTGRLVASGGKVKVTGQKVKVAGEVDVSGPKAGKIAIKATRQATVTGKLLATGSAGTGGTITVASDTVSLLLATIEASGAFGGGNIRLGPQGAAAPTSTTTIDGASTVRADAIQSGNGGTVIVTSADTTRSSGLITALGGAGGTGGVVQVLGRRVALENNAIVDVSGPAGGGTVLIGGDFQGKNADIPNAFQTFVGSHATIRADAIAVGDGGKIIVWADDWTKFYGNISARGGAESGNGGFAEVSGKQSLAFTGKVDLGAPAGKLGTLLLDPDNIRIVTTGANDVLLADSLVAFGEAAATDVTVSGTTIGAIAGAVVLQAQNNITVAAPGADPLTDGGAINKPTGDLTMRAGNSIVVNDTIALGSGTLTLSARDPGAAAQAAGGTVTIAAAVSAAGAITITNNGSNAALGLGANVTATSVTLTGGAGGITQSAGSIAATTLNANATGAVTLNQAGNAFTNLGASSGNGFTLVDTGGLTVTGAVNGGTGTTSIATTGNLTVNAAVSGNAGVALTAGGAVTISNPVSSGGAVQLTAAAGVTLNGSNATVTTTGTYTVNADSNADGAGTYTQNNAGSAVSSGAVSITAADLDLVGTINNGAANVTLQPSTNGATIGVGAGAANFNVSNAHLGQITTTGLLTIGNTSNVGGITVGSDGAVAGGSKNIELVTADVITVNAANGISTTGTLTFSANDMTLGGGAIQGSAVTLRNTNVNRPIDLGTNAAGTVGLTSAEIDTITATGGTLTIGRNDGSASGNITISGAIAPTGATTLVLRTGQAITQTAGSIVETNLGLVAGAGVTMTNGGNNVANLTGIVTGTGNFAYTDTDTFSVVGNTAVNATATTGVSVNNGSLSLTGTGVTLASNLFTDNKGAASTVSITGPVTINAASVTIDTNSTAGNTAGNVTFANKIEGQAAGTNTLIVDARSSGTGGAVTFSDTAGATTRLAGLAVAGASASFTGTNNVDNLAAALSGAGNGVTYADANALTVSTVGGIVGVTTNSGAVSLTAVGSLTVSNVVNTTGTGTTTLASTAGAVIAVNDTVGNASSTTTLTSNGAINGNGTVIGTSVTLDSANGIGTGSGGRLATAADTLAARASASGGVFVSEANGVTLSTIGAVANGAAGGGAFDLTAGGAITVSGAVNTPGTGATTLLTSSGDIALGAGVGNSSAATTLTAAAAITRSAGTVSGTTVTLSAATGIGSDAPVNTAAATISATNSTSGNIDILEATGVDIAGLTTSGGNGSIQLVTTNGSITTSGAIGANGSGNVTLRAQGAGSTLVLNTAITSGTGNVILAGQDGVTLNGASADVTISATGIYTVDADSNSDGTGTYTQGGAGAIVSAPGGVDIRAADVQLSGTIATGASNVTLRTSTAGASIGVEDSSRNFKLTNAELNQIATTGTITIGAATNTGGISIGVDAALSQGAKNFQFTTAGNIGFGNNNFTTTGNFGLTASNGGGTASISTTGGFLVANTVTALANAGIALNTNANTLSATNTGNAGSITITEQNGVTVTALQQTGTSAGTISLTSNTGNIALNNGAVVSQGGLITLTATAGAITDADGGTAVSISNPSGQATLSAATGIGPTEHVDTQVATLLATNSGTTGDIRVSDADGLIVRRAAQTNAGASSGGISILAAGPLTVEAAGSGGLGVAIVGTAASSGTITLLTSGNGTALSIANAVSSRAGAIKLQSAANVTLGAAGSVSSAATGDAIVLAANGNFINDGGANAVQAPNGRWLIYSQATDDPATAPTGNNFGGLPGKSYYGDPFNFATGQFTTTPNAGNRFVFGFQPTLAVTPDTKTVTYNGAVQNDTYAITGVLPADLAADAASGTPTLSGVTSKNAGVYTVTSSQGSLTSDLNYAFSFGSGTLTVAPAPLSIAAVSASKIYDAATSSTAAPTVTGLQGGDTVTALAESYDAANVGNRTLSLNGGFVVNDGNSGGNYTVTTTQTASGSITPRPITVIADPKVRPAGVANPPLTFTIGGLGLVAGEGLSGGLVTSATVASQVGLYPITQGTLSASGNYALTFVPGVLAVVPSLAITDSSMLGSTVVRDAFGNGFLAVTPVSTMVTIGSSSDPNGPVMVFEDPRFGGWLVCLGAAGMKACSAKPPQ